MFLKLFLEKKHKKCFYIYDVNLSSMACLARVKVGSVHLCWVTLCDPCGR